MKKHLEKIQQREYTVGVIGLGYVGLPLLVSFHKKGFNVIGFDVDPSKIELLQKGTSYIKHFESADIEVLSNSERCTVTTDFSKLGMVDAILICVPTPLDKYRAPDMSFVIQTGNTIARFLKKGQLVVLESTTWPGTTDELLTNILEEKSGLVSGVDFYIAYSPEREDPGNTNFETVTIPKVVGALNGNAKKIAIELYSSVINKVVPVSSARVAEASKLLENIFRSVNIALVNEMKVVLDTMGIDIHETIEAASTKPFGFMKFTPGPGLGGHCIPIDPFYLTWKAKEFGLDSRFIELAGEVNTAMPQYVIDKAILALNKNKKSINGSKILVIGIAYKPNVDDMRESPSFPIMDKLFELGAIVDFYDNWIPEIPPSRDHKNWQGRKSILWNEEKIKSFDAAIIVTNHSDIPYHQLVEWCNCIIDSRNVMKNYTPRNENHIFKA